MKTDRFAALTIACAACCLSLPAEAVDRIHAGQWVGSWTGGGRTRATSNCMTQADADAMNGDARAIRGYLEATIPPTVCKLSDIKANGGEVTYTAVCGGGKPNMITTTYHGESLESTDSSGAKSEAKRVGPCK